MSDKYDEKAEQVWNKLCVDDFSSKQIDRIAAFGRECAAQAFEEGRADGLFEANAVYQLKHPKSVIINGPAMSEVARRGWVIREQAAALRTPRPADTEKEG